LPLLLRSGDDDVTEKPAGKSLRRVRFTHHVAWLEASTEARTTGLSLVPSCDLVRLHSQASPGIHCRSQVQLGNEGINVLGGTGILPVWTTDRKPVPPMHRRTRWPPVDKPGGLAVSCLWLAA